MKKLRLGIIGTCCRGQLGDYAHNPAEGVEIVAGTDIYEAQRNSFVERYQKEKNTSVNVYSDYREMIEKENLDGVFITSPDYCHEEQAIFALQNKIAVYLEKPIAITLDGADRILRTAKENNTRLMLGHNMRYMEFTNKMREIIKSGIIGDVKAIWCRHFVSYGGDAYFRDWHADRANTGSLLLQKGAHDIDIIHWLADSRTVRVNGIGSLSVYGTVPRRPVGKEKLDCLTILDVWKLSQYPVDVLKDYYPNVNNEDINMVNLQLANGIQACYLQCHFTPDSCRNYTIIGTKGRIENYGDCDKSATVQVWTNRTDTFKLEGDITYRLNQSSLAHGGADPKIVRSFVDMLRNGGIPESTPQGARYAVAAGLMGAQSIRNCGMPYDIPALDEDLENFDFSLNR